MTKHNAWFFLWILFFPASLLKAATVSQAQNDLQQVEVKIQALQQTLSHVQNKNELLHQELAQTEKKISLSIQSLRQTQEKILKKKQQINLVEQEIRNLSKKLQDEQDLLAQHLKARYSMGEYQALEWLLNQNNPFDSNRLLTLYQYIVQARQTLIHEILTTRETLLPHQKQLQHDLLSLEQLQHQLLATQQKLKQEKHYNSSIVDALFKQIQSKQQALTEYQQNKTSLSQLLYSLIHRAPTTAPEKLFRFTEAHLTRPVQVSGQQLKNVNQGILFTAPEGMPIAAISPGTVVFSDWLRGYGLLLIIDHGHGLMSLYAHNQSIFKQKGDNVKQGEQIATVGHSGGLKENGLYFELRQRGKAIPPQKWLS
jgi:septal ring factor EnvC (AmiA/AmiB activator)